MPTPLRSLVTAVVATAVTIGVGIGVTGGIGAGQDDDPVEPGAVPSVPLEELDTTSLAVRRTGFCAAVDPERVAEAIGGRPAAELSYAPGDPAPVGSGTGDVAHEHGCRWSGAGGRAAAWVFTPPVTADRAGELARAATRARGCTAVPEAPAYGAPSAALVCTTGRRTEVSFRGLFGDAWLVCALAADGRLDDPAAVSELTDRAGRWCAAVATAAASPDEG